MGHPEPERRAIRCLSARPVVAAAWARAGASSGDVVLLDGAAPPAAGWSVPRGARLVVLAADDLAAVPVEHRGAVVGVVTEEDSLDDLRSALEAACEGRTYTSPSGLALLLRSWARPDVEERRRTAPSLSARERELWHAMAEGLSTKRIAAQLGVAVKTVESHRSRLFAKLGVSTQSEAIALAFAEGEVGAR